MSWAKGHARMAKNHLAAKRRAYRQLWRVVDGAVFDCLYHHPDYLTDKGRVAARMSINKRVVGAVLGFAEESARGRSEEISAADRVSDFQRPTPARCAYVPRKRGGWLGKAIRLIWRRP